MLSKDRLVAGGFIVVVAALLYDMTIHHWYGFAPPKAFQLGGGRLPRQSPVVIVGGSILLYSKAAWSDCEMAGAYVCTTASVSSDTSSISLDGVRPKAGPGATAWAGLLSWTIELCARTADCEFLPSGVVDPSKTAGITVTGSAGTVKVVTHYPNNTKPVEFLVELPSAKATSRALRYYDKTLDDQHPFEEHIGQIAVFGAVPGCSTAPCIYDCPDGQCNVYIGEPQ